FFAPVGEVAVSDLSADGEILVTGHPDGTIKIWSMKTGKLATKPVSRSRSDPFSSRPKLSPDGAWLLSEEGGADKLWDLHEGREIAPPDGDDHFSLSDISNSSRMGESWSPDGKWIVSYFLGYAQIWSARPFHPASKGFKLSRDWLLSTPL